MAYDEFLADRIRKALSEVQVKYSEKKMFGGIAFMVEDKMCMGVIKDKLMARVGPEAHEEALKLQGASPMDFTGRPMKGYLFVEPIGLDHEEQFDHWISLCLAFNPLAKSSKKP